MVTWHILDARSIWIKEFASALSKRVPVCAWSPRMSWTGLTGGADRVQTLADPPLTLRHFPLQRGYSRFPVSSLVRLGPALTARLAKQVRSSESDVLICTTPFYAPVAEHWPGPVIYYQTDFTAGYEGLHAPQVRSLDARLCRRADAVCPNSQRIRAYMMDLGCAASKITIVPNATRQANVLSRLDCVPGPLPADASDLPRPIAGVIGNLAANMDWVYLRELIARTPEFSWLFVGPTTMPVRDPEQSAARDFLFRQGVNVRFLGARPYGQLQSYARAFDVAVLPYRKHEPTYSGSSTRFYEHLAACRPMVATRGFAELLEKEPLLQLADTAEHAADVMNTLRDRQFVDGQELARWEASRSGTWEERAATLIAALRRRSADKTSSDGSDALPNPHLALSGGTGR